MAINASSSNSKEKDSSSDEFVSMNFKVIKDFRKDYKAYANEHDMTMTELLEKSFELFKKSNK